MNPKRDVFGISGVGRCPKSAGANCSSFRRTGWQCRSVFVRFLPRYDTPSALRNTLLDNGHYIVHAASSPVSHVCAVVVVVVVLTTSAAALSPRYCGRSGEALACTNGSLVICKAC